MTVRVKRERPDQRRFHRITAPLFVDVAGWRVRAADWSIGGLRIADFPEELPQIGDELRLHIHLPFQGFDVSFDVTGEVSRTDPEDSMFAVKFIDMGEREGELMSHFIEELVRGSMSGVEDTIQRIDVPVTPASLEPEANPREELPVRRLPVKTITMTGMYILLGVFVFTYAALLMYSNFYQLEVQTAVVNAPVETIRSGVNGRLELTGIKPGDRVSKGQVIADMHDTQLEREIELADIAIREQKARLAYLKTRQLQELDKVESFATVEMKNVQQTRLNVESLQAQFSAARNRLARLKVLHRKGYTTLERLEQADKEKVRLAKALESSRIELSSRAVLASRNVGKSLYTGERIVGDLGDVQAKVQLARHELELSRSKRRTLTRHRDRLAIIAPFDGTLLTLPKGFSGAVRKGDIVALIEKRAERHILAFLTQDEVLKVGQGDEANLFIPATGETLKGRVINIDRTRGFIREQNVRHSPGYGWRGPKDRSAQVTIGFDGVEAQTAGQELPTGLPAIVIFPRRSNNPLLTSIARKFQLLL
ncbi:MAG: HlyD family efflux transporter periplasmic adaptor subunit [Pseudomonadota bacterium]